MIKIPPTTVKNANALPKNQSTIAMMNIVSLSQQRSEGDEYIAPTLDNTGDVSDTIVRKLAVKPTLLRILIARNNAALGDGSSNTSRPVKWRIGSGIHMNNMVNRPMPVVQALEKRIERYGPMGETAHARALYSTSYSPYRTAPHAMMASPINRR